MNGGFVRSMIHQIRTASAQEASKTVTALPSMSVKMTLFQIARLAVHTSKSFWRTLRKEKLDTTQYIGPGLIWILKKWLGGKKCAIQLSHQYLDSLSLVDLPPPPPRPAIQSEIMTSDHMVNCSSYIVSFAYTSATFFLLFAYWWFLLQQSIVQKYLLL